MIDYTGIDIDTNSSFTNPLNFQESGEHASIEATGLEPQQNYYARAYIIQDGQILYSDNVEQFTTAVDLSEPFYFENTGDAAKTVTILKSNSSAPTLTIEVSSDRLTWSELGQTSDTAPLNITVPAGEKVYMRCNTNRWSSSASNNNIISFDDTVGGNIMSLLYGSSFDGTETTFPGATSYQFDRLFNASSITNANKLLLPATTLTTACYQQLFQNCGSLETAPALPATTLANQCYLGLFNGCTSLTTPPALNATTLANQCYSNMFRESGITTAPVLPATTLATSCYTAMFRGCTNLTSVPNLPATTAAYACYQQMFMGCSSLTTIQTTLPATTLASYCYSEMYESCTGITTAPILPADTLTTQCYSLMFNGCSSLNYIKCLATNGINTNNSTTNWVQNVAAAGTFVETLGANWPIGNNGIPTSWVVQDEIDYTEPFYLENTTGTNKTALIKKNNSSAPTLTIEVSSDKSTWTTLGTTSTTALDVTVPANSKVYLRCNTNRWCNWPGGTDYYYNSIDYSDAIGGNTMSLLYGENFTGSETSMRGDRDFCYLFYNSNITDTSKLLLPGTNLGGVDYYYMFANCASLTSTPKSLPATTVGQYSYSNMFRGCTSLTTISFTLPADTLASNCYDNMFRNCSSLTTPPALPATTLANYCYQYMFRDCSSLTTAPALPATTLTTSCYQQMFAYCTSLTTAPTLPATTLTVNCYREMFYGCSSLTTASVLSATTLANNCCYGMFQGCTNLTTAPALSATTLTQYCYYQMFRNCSSLNYIKCLATTGINTNDSTTNWVQNVAAAGTFVETLGANWPIGNNGIPTSWVVQDEIDYTEPFYLENTTGTNKTALIKKNNSSAPTLTIEVSSDKSTWTTLGTTSTTALDVTVPANSKVYLRCTAYQWATTVSTNNIISFDDTIGGNVMSLLYGSSFVGTETTFPGTTTHQFDKLFSASSITNAKKLLLPATTLTNYCYYQMFLGCTALTSAPALPANALAIGCYYEMFRNCSSLTSAPALPATTLTNQCYYGMFRNCSLLTSAPALPATTMVSQCYYLMFRDCSSLTQAPTISATSTYTSSCEYMFENCSSLTTATALLATSVDTRAYYGMFSGCTSLTQAPTISATTIWDEGCSRMFENCTSLTTSPVLLATNLHADCYTYMFNGCTSLNSITCLATGNIDSYTYTNTWVNNVAANGTFTKASAATWTTGIGGIPDNWTVVNQ